MREIHLTPTIAGRYSNGTSGFYFMDGTTIEPWRARRRTRILESAAHLFARMAFASVRMSDVAHAAGIGKGTLYRYFASKEELYLAIFDRSLSELDCRLADVARSGRSPPEALAAMLEALIEVFSRHLPTLRAISGEHLQLADQGRSLLRRHRANIEASLRRALESGVDSGDFGALDCELAPSLLIGLVRGAVMASAKAPRERLTPAVLGLALAGVLQRPQAASDRPVALAMAGGGA